VEGKKYRALRKDCQAVSEVVGQILMIAIVVIAFSSIAALIFSDKVVNPPHTPHTNLQERIDPMSNKLYIFNVGGEAIDLKDVNIVLVNATDTHMRAEFNLSSESGFNFSATNDVLMLGDSVIINPTKEGINLSTDDIVMLFVYTPSQQVIQKVTLHDGK
jgi:FlaG/FlaF family flagellin (archaellin)